MGEAGAARSGPRTPVRRTGQEVGLALKPLSDRVEIRIRPGVLWGGWTVVRSWGRFRVTMSDRTVRVDKLGAWNKPNEWTETFSGVRLTRLDLHWSEVTMSKWIKAALGRKQKGKAEALPADPALCDGRPALTEFLTETAGANGGVREPSVIMACVVPEGVRVGLKDDDAGGWCWRVGKTFQEALDAIERALTADEPAFRAGRQVRQGKRR